MKTAISAVQALALVVIALALGKIALFVGRFPSESEIRSNPAKLREIPFIKVDASVGGTVDVDGSVGIDGDVSAEIKGHPGYAIPVDVRQ